MDTIKARGQKKLLERVKSIKVGYYGHIVRNCKSLESKEMIQIRMSGCRGRGQQ